MNQSPLPPPSSHKPDFSSSPTSWTSPSKPSRSQRRAERRADKSVKEELKRGKPLSPRTPHQAELMSALDEYPVVFALGPAGTGKTYIASRHALARLVSGVNEKITVIRPTVAPARHRLGFQPGNVNAKLRPWLVPVMDAFHDGLAVAQIDRFVTNRQIEFLGFEHARGRTLPGTTILDEAQNCSLSDLELMVTRIGDGGQIVICGDPWQTDLEDSGLMRLAEMVEQFKLNAAVVRFDENDVVRSATAAEWVKAFAAARRQGLPLARAA